MKTFHERIQNRDYHTTLPWGPSRETRDAYHADQRRLEAQFKADLFEEYGVTGHPKADKAYAIAWEHGHASGFSEIEAFFSEIVCLIQ